MKFWRFIRPFVIVAVLSGFAFAGYATRAYWLPYLDPPKTVVPTESAVDAATPASKVIVNEQAQQNLGLIAKPLKAQTFWKSIQVPGMVVDRPGLSDRGVVAPATGVVARIAHVPGDTVRPGEVLREYLPEKMTFGRGGTGGIINRVTKVAGWDAARELRLEAGMYDHFRGGIDFGGPVSDAVALRLTGVYQNSGSYRDGVDYERWGLNPTAAFAGPGPSDARKLFTA